MTDRETPAQAIRGLIDFLRDFYLERDGEEQPPAFFLWRESGDNMMVLTPFGDERDKNAVAAMMKARVEELGDVFMYAFVAEAWQVKVPKGTPQPAVLPRDHPERVEIVSIQVASRGEGVTGTALRIIRNPEGKVIDLQRDNGGDTWHSRFDLFDQLKTSLAT
jgi:hypothetical protein